MIQTSYWLFKSILLEISAAHNRILPKLSDHCAELQSNLTILKLKSVWSKWNLKSYEHSNGGKGKTSRRKTSQTFQISQKNLKTNWKLKAFPKKSIQWLVWGFSNRTERQTKEFEWNDVQRLSTRKEIWFRDKHVNILNFIIALYSSFIIYKLKGIIVK